MYSEYYKEDLSMSYVSAGVLFFLFFIQFPILGESSKLTPEQKQAVEEFCSETLKHIHRLKPSKQEQIITIIDDSPLPVNISKVDIAKIEIDRVTKWVNLEIPYKLEPAPLLLEDEENLD